MADAIQGLSIGLGLDTAGIDQSLKQLKGKLSLVNSEMKNNMSAFDRGEKSVGKYETQLTGLNKKLELQKSATAAAKTEYDKMVSVHGEGSVQADKASKAYNDQSASLNNLERYVGDLTDEFKAFQNEQDVTNSKFGKLSESMEKMGAKMSAVGDKMKSVGTGLTKAITAPIVGIGVAAFAAANDFDKASNTIRAGTGATGDALADLEDSFKTVFKTVPEDAETVSGALADINTRTGLAGVPLEDLTKKFLDLSRITGEDVSTSIADMTRTFGTWDVAAEDSGSTMDYLWKVAQTTGIGVADLTGLLDKNGETFQALGYNMEESAALLGHWEKTGANSEVMLTGLKKGLQNLADAGKDPQKVLPELISQIESAGTESEAMGIAMELFGKKAGPEMAMAIRDGNLSVDDLLATLDGSGETIGAAAEETMSLADQFVLLKNNTMAALEPIGTIMLDLAKQYLPPLIEAVGKVAEEFEGMSDKTQKMVLVFGGIAAAIGPVLVVAGSLISMFGGMMTALAPLLLKISQAGGLFKYLRVALAAFTGPVGIAVAVIAGLTIGFIALYKNSETFRDMIGTLITKVKELATQALAVLQPAIAGIVSFFKDQLKVIQDFWTQNSATIIGALENIGKFVGVIFGGILTVIQFIMPAILALISAVWGNIKGVITGALDIIMGAVKVFSGLFSGDFGKMWDGLKQMFSGAVTFLWNLISLTFFGKLLGGVKVFVGAFRGFFTSMWATLKTLFTSTTGTLKTTISNAWSSISSTTSTIFGSIWTFIKNIFTKIRDSISSAISTIYSNIVTRWTDIFNRTSSIFGTVRDLISRIFTNIKDTVSNLVGNVLSKVTGTWNTLKSNTSRIFGDIFTGIKNKFTDIVNAAKALPQRIGDGIGSMATKVKSGVTRVINNLASTLGKGVNGVIGGINWVLGKIGVDSKVPEWAVPKYAQGTKGHHPGGPMIVGDGKGSNSGPELIETPDGKQGLSPSKPTLSFAPKGTKVWSATETRKILDMVPHYALGDKIRSAGEWVADKYNSGKEKVKSVGSKIKDVAVDAFDYIKEPGKFLDLALKTLGIDKPKGGSFVGNMALGGWNKVKSGAIDYIKNKMSDFGSTQSGISVGGGSSGNFGAPFRFTSGYGPRNTGIPGASTFHKGYDWAAPTGTPIPSVTDGIGYRTGFHRLSGNFVEVKSGNKIHRYQHNSKNIMRVGQQVKKGQTVGLVGSTGVGSGAHLHYETRGLETGGIVNKEQLVRVGEKNREEVVIPMHPSRRTDAMKLLALAGRRLSGGGDKGITRPNQIPSVGGGSNNDSVLKSLLAATMKQNEILMQLLNKDTNLYVDGDALAGAIGDPIDSRLGNSSRNNMYMNGVR